ncbi:MAG: hypothetical protein JXM73_26535 [Anaerolineae bacterium]|nr:hypothetical protein [Anaerolineae bacterium]
MSESTPTLDEWRRLYAAAMRIKEIAPWQWMSETDVFGVQDPETQELGFVSVMGEMGEHLALALYLGAEGLTRFWEFCEAADFAPPEAVLGLLRLEASFEDRNELTPKDRDTIKALGLTFRGRQAWPMFRSFRPGYVPWYLEPQEVRFLACALEQAAEVAPRLQADPGMLAATDETSYLVRVRSKKGQRPAWHDQVLRVPPVEPRSISVPMDTDVLEQAMQIERRVPSLEVDFPMVPVHVGEKGTRPYFPRMLLVVESESGMVLSTELLRPDPGVDDMWGIVPLTLVQQWVKFGILPRQVRVRSPSLGQLVGLLAQELAFDVQVVDAAMPALDEAKAFILDRFV